AKGGEGGHDLHSTRLRIKSAELAIGPDAWPRFPPKIPDLTIWGKSSSLIDWIYLTFELLL
ncbi:MAG: hypothetical protein Q8P59_08395, partial [Dehalococcoidia bacterium]|nr:hypothetical protein [Dehalococcoidia bacterium]